MTGHLFRVREGQNKIGKVIGETSTIDLREMLHKKKVEEKRRSAEWIVPTMEKFSSMRETQAC